jgi:hypothetical protein
MDPWPYRYEQVRQIADQRLLEAEGARLAARVPRRKSDPTIVRLQRLLIELLLLPFTVSQSVASEDRRLRGSHVRSVEP